MRIREIKIEEIKVPLVTPFKTALRTVNAIEDILVTIKTDTEEIGYGEAAPTAAITGDTKGSIITAIKDYIAPAIRGMDIEELDEIMRRIRTSIQKNTSAKAAVDMAIYDLYAKNLKRPLYKVLGGSKEELETDITISLNDTKEMVEDSIDAVNRGFRILKIKVGKNSYKDVERVAFIRKAVGDEVILRVDANQGWEPKEAIRLIRAMEEKGLNIDLVEQPVKAHDLKGMKWVTENVHTPILADESVFSLEDAITIIQEHAADFINIKLMKTGGIYEALKICSIAETYKVQCMIGCMLESKISVSAAAHLAAAKNIITRADLDGPSLCRIDPYIGGPQYNGPHIKMTQAYGIGIKEIKNI